MYTPGPWIIDPEIEIPNIQAANPIRSICMCFTRETDNDAEFNARLIAAAPELFEACKAALLRLDKERWDGEETAEEIKLRAAIAKAEGADNA